MHASQMQHAKLSEDRIAREPVRASPFHIVPSDTISISR
jgi:hypothetical protein